MNMPGFTAEAGLVSTTKTIWRVGAQAPMHRGVVPQVLVPVDEDFPPFDRLPTGFLSCYKDCRMMIDPNTGKKRSRKACIFDCIF
jgi:hypothetical protein